jgi:hypothetical protein
MVVRAHPISRYQPYLQQALTHFFDFGRPSLQLGRMLTERCPRLLSLNISVPTSREDEAASKRDTAELVEFLRCCSLPLERLGISCPTPVCSQTTALFELLSRRPALVELIINVEDAGAAAGLEAVCDKKRQSGGSIVPFGELRALHTVTISPYVGYLSQVIEFVCH